MSALFDTSSADRRRRLPELPVFDPSYLQRLQERGLVPFAYRVISIEEVPHTWGPQLNIDLETTVEVAKQATEADLQTLWQQIEPSLGNRRVFFLFRTDVPGVDPWGIISRRGAATVRSLCWRSHIAILRIA
ncbi:MAG: hypothetical protein ACYC0X_34420 [Pirellulaceae bacterium]